MERVPTRLDRAMWALQGRPTRRRSVVLVPLVGLCLIGVLMGVAVLAEGYSGDNVVFFLTFLCLGLAQVSSGLSRFVYDERVILARVLGSMSVLLFAACLVLIAVQLAY